mmetsp:Transcript_93155/g.279462  ORF Transcript_93155/g.279462 Transcript_93155/m.279462 type:complete len:105 (+) Transcript_93155:266-580(+)
MALLLSQASPLHNSLSAPVAKCWVSSLEVSDRDVLPSERRTVQHAARARAQLSRSLSHTCGHSAHATCFLCCSAVLTEYTVAVHKVDSIVVLVHLEAIKLHCSP